MNPNARVPRSVSDGPENAGAAVKSVLRYPGGKSRAVHILSDFIPRDEIAVCSPFLGGGSFELHCATALDLRVFAYDIFSPLVEFWGQLLSRPKLLASRAESYLPVLARAAFYRLQQDQTKLRSAVERAAAFYVVNRSSFSGCTLSGGMSPGHARFTPSAVERVRAFPHRAVAKKMSVGEADFGLSIAMHPGALIYADPPYLLDNPNLYGKRGDCHAAFDHLGLRDLLMERGGRWLLSYNDSPAVRALYPAQAIITPQWRYGMGNNKDSREVLILSSELRDALNSQRRKAA